MPVFIQDTGTASSGRKQCADFKMQATGTGASGRVDVARIYCQVEGTGSAGRKLVWERAAYSPFYTDYAMQGTPTVSNQGSGVASLHAYICFFGDDIVSKVQALGSTQLFTTSDTLNCDIAGGVWTIMHHIEHAGIPCAMLHFYVENAKAYGSGVLFCRLVNEVNPTNTLILKYEYKLFGGVPCFELRLPDDTLLGLWQG